MASPASFAEASHPPHVGCLFNSALDLLFSLRCDLCDGLGGPVWSEMAFYTMAGGLFGALAALSRDTLIIAQSPTPPSERSVSGICSSI